jgi:hypothetical protein
LSVTPSIPACMNCVLDLYGSTSAGPNASTEKSYPQILQLVRSSISCSIHRVSSRALGNTLELQKMTYQSWTHFEHLGSISNCGVIRDRCLRHTKRINDQRGLILLVTAHSTHPLASVTHASNSLNLERTAPGRWDEIPYRVWECKVTRSVDGRETSLFSIQLTLDIIRRTYSPTSPFTLRISWRCFTVFSQILSLFAIIDLTLPRLNDSVIELETPDNPSSVPK